MFTLRDVFATSIFQPFVFAQIYAYAFKKEKLKIRLKEVFLILPSLFSVFTTNFYLFTKEAFQYLYQYMCFCKVKSIAVTLCLFILFQISFFFFLLEKNVITFYTYSNIAGYLKSHQIVIENPSVKTFKYSSLIIF